MSPKSDHRGTRSAQRRTLLTQFAAQDHPEPRHPKRIRCRDDLAISRLGPDW